MKLILLTPWLLHSSTGGQGRVPGHHSQICCSGLSSLQQSLGMYGQYNGTVVLGQRLYIEEKEASSAIENNVNYWLCTT